MPEQQQPDPRQPGGLIPPDQLTGWPEGGHVDSACDADTPPPWLTGCIYGVGVDVAADGVVGVALESVDGGQAIRVLDTDRHMPDIDAAVRRLLQRRMRPEDDARPIGVLAAAWLRAHLPAGTPFNLGGWQRAFAERAYRIQAEHRIGWTRVFGIAADLAATDGDVYQTTGQAWSDQANSDPIANIRALTDRLNQVDEQTAARARRRTERQRDADHRAAVAATGDRIADIDAAMAGDCACGCGIPIDDASPSAYFATPGCQWRWSQRNADVAPGFYRTEDAAVTIYNDLHGRPGQRHTDHVHIDARGPAGQATQLAGHIAAARREADLRGHRYMPAPGPARDIMPEAALDELARRLALLGIIPNRLAEIPADLQCRITRCPDILGAGYRVPCRGCQQEPTRPTVYQVFLPLRGPNPRCILIGECSTCRMVWPNPVMVSGLVYVRLQDELNDDFLNFTLSNGMQMAERRVSARQLIEDPDPAGLVHSVWNDLELRLELAATPPGHPLHDELRRRVEAHAQLMLRGPAVIDADGRHPPAIRPVTD